MRVALFVLIAGLLAATPAWAAENTSATAPAQETTITKGTKAYQKPKASPATNAAAPSLNPADIEPAAGTEDEAEASRDAFHETIRLPRKN